jgi:chorismate lyase / 3-hydroxybenzoate synthase
MRAPRGLHLDYVSPAEYQAARWADVLGVATFNGRDAHGPSTDVPAAGVLAAPAAAGNGASAIPVAQVSTPVLPAATHVCEVWRCGERAESGQHQGVRFRRTADMLFGCIALSEGRSRAHPTLQEATTHAYREMCATLDAHGYPHLLRVWNYLPDINGDSSGTERYREFNTARRQALRACGRPLTGNVPAASALGAAADSPVVVYFLAARTAPTCVENPRQVSAYHYPRQYGTHSPVFSRATVLQQQRSAALFISGTASIVGHRSLHVGDAAAQTREALTNIEALLGEANRRTPGARFTFGALACKVYVRRPRDLAAIRRELDSAVGPATRAVYLQADICRQDLLVEIEAAGTCPLAASA